jgi:predicted nicotinamide N-methyase
MSDLSDSSTPSDDSITGVSSIAYGFMGSQALFAALELGLFTALADGPTEAAALAGRIGARPEPFEALLAACLALGLIERTGEGYRNTPAAQRYLVRHARGYIGDYYLRQIGETLYAQIPVARAVLRGQTGPTTYSQFLDVPARTEEFIRGQHAGSSGPAHLLAKSTDLSAFKCLLDLGGGSGAFSIAAARRYAQLSAIVFDHPKVIAVAERIIREAKLADRIRCMPGNVLTNAWPQGADLVLMSYVVSSYRPETFRELLDKIRGYLPAGGGLVIHDFALHHDRPGPRNAALWSFANLAISATTHPYTIAEITQALQAAGFVDVIARPHVPGITFLFTARRG